MDGIKLMSGWNGLEMIKSLIVKLSLLFFFHFSFFIIISTTATVGYEPKAKMPVAHHMLLYGCGKMGSSADVWWVVDG